MPSKLAVRAVPAPDAWDAFVAGHADGNFLQSWRWGDLKARYGWRPLRLGVFEGATMLAGAQILMRVRRLPPLGPAAGVAYVPRGPLADSVQQAESLLAAAVKAARAGGASFVRVEPPARASLAALRDLRFRPTPQFVQIPRTALVDLRPELDRVMASFKPKMRYNIRLALRRGVEISEARADADFEDFLRLTRITAEREAFAIHSPAYYRDVWRSFLPEHAAMFIARLHGEPLSALLTLRFGPTAVYLYGASSNRHRNLMAPHALQWAAMQWARSHRCEWYDLWGMADPGVGSDPLAGVHRFKLGFNPRSLEYPGAFDRAIDPVRAWALSSGMLRLRDVVARLRNRPARAAAG